MLKRQVSSRPLRIVAGAVVLAASLAACGHHNNSQPSAVSQFISFVTSIVNKGAADSDEPDPKVSGIVPATTETGEPVALQ
jgi:hypothetical protein